MYAFLAAQDKLASDAVNTCVLNSDCPKYEACFNRMCISPCNENTCASNAQCTVYNHLPMCTCPNEMEGDPFDECRPNIKPTFICTVSSECPSDQACINKKCTVLCPGTCGLNASKSKWTSSIFNKQIRESMISLIHANVFKFLFRLSCCKP